MAGLPGLDGTRAQGACAWGSDDEAYDPTSDHHDDQTRLWAHQQWVDFPFTEEEIAADLVSTKTVTNAADDGRWCRAARRVRAGRRRGAAAPPGSSSVLLTLTFRARSTLDAERVGQSPGVDVGT